jgi:putative ABC transport system substrate-binding protein
MLASSSEAGALMSYGVSLPTSFYRAAYFVDKVLKGEKPADLPVEFPTKIEMIINLKTAKALGIGIPASVKVLADEVIE